MMPDWIGIAALMILIYILGYMGGKINRKD